MIWFLFLLLISLNFTIASSNKRYGAGLDIGSKGSGVFLNYLLGNVEKNFDLVGEIRYFDIKGETESIVWDYIMQEYVTIGSQNLLFIPMLVGFNYHPFAGQIANNFSPFITFRGGLNFSIDGKEGNGSYKETWRKADTQCPLLYRSI